jgi:uncharacterized protein YjiK
MVWTVAQAQTSSIAATLGQYAASLPVLSVAGVTAQSFSGVAYQPETKSLYVVDNDNNSIYVLNTAGVLQRTITSQGFADLEGIVYQGQDFFLVSEEGLANVVRVSLPRTGTGPVEHSAGVVLNLGANMSNSGIEGVGYNVAKKMAYAVKEISPTRLYRITVDSAGKPLAAFPDEPFSLTGKTGDAADIYALNDGNFLVVNQEENKLEGYDASGKFISSLALGLNKPEGLAVDTTDGTLYVVGEAHEFRVFKKPVTNLGAKASFRPTAYRNPLVAGFRGVLLHAPAEPSRLPVKADGRPIPGW